MALEEGSVWVEKVMEVVEEMKVMMVMVVMMVMICISFSFPSPVTRHPSLVTHQLPHLDHRVRLLH